MTLTVKDLMEPLLHTDFGDEFLIAKLEGSMEFSFNWLEWQSQQLPMNDLVFQDFVDNVAYVRACIKVLQWFSIRDYTEETIRANKYSLILEDRF
jgi:hypothetical protein